MLPLLIEEIGMARLRKQHASVTANQALYIVERALADRKLSSADIARYVDAMRREIASLEERVAYLTSALVEPIKHVITEVKAAVKKRKRKGPRKAVTAERQASMKLQGEYLRSLRSIPERQRGRFKRLAKAEGREKAIAEMKKIVGK
jgi:hypothetical protein